MSKSQKRVRVAAVADLHCTRNSQGLFLGLFTEVNARGAGRRGRGALTNHGLPEEDQVVVRDLTAAVKSPTLAVLGNHDWHSGKHEELEQILSEAGVKVLDGDDYEVLGIGFAG